MKRNKRRAFIAFISLMFSGSVAYAADTYPKTPSCKDEDKIVSVSQLPLEGYVCEEKERTLTAEGEAKYSCNFCGYKQYTDGVDTWLVEVKQAAFTSRLVYDVTYKCINGDTPPKEYSPVILMVVDSMKMYGQRGTCHNFD